MVYIIYLHIWSSIFSMTYKCKNYALTVYLFSVNYETLYICPN